MANYSYDEGGNMAAYFVITFLALILIPLTLSISPSSKKRILTGCQCSLCVEQRSRIAKREGGSILKPTFSVKSIFLIFGWSLLVFLSYKVANAKLDNKIYDPFEILGLSTSATEKEIKSHYKKLSKIYHPDKVKATVNETIELIQNRFVDLTKAYKSLTDETIRENLRKYGNPDGPQQTSVGIALPKWIVESKNNVWVLGLYGLIFGGALPTLVGRWWFGSRQKTKDGIRANSAAAFFKALKEDSTMDDVVGTLGTVYKWELANKKAKSGETVELDRLEKNIATIAPKQWETLKALIDAGKDDRRSTILVYAHLLRLKVESSSLQKEQTQILLQTPLLLNALLNISISRNWLTPTIYVMRLHGYLTQALLPRPSFAKQDRLSQLPGIKGEDTLKSADIAEVVGELEAKSDSRVEDVKKAVSQWSRLELVDASYKVIGERIITPSSIVYLVVKLRISPPTSNSTVTAKEPSVEEVKRNIKVNDEKEEQFLMGRNDAEPVKDEGASGWAHAPYWPENRRPGWWLILADDKNSRVVVPPMKITNVPFSDPNAGDRNYRAYKLQFQAPQGPGMYTWKIYLISDTFVGEELSQNMTLKIDDVSALNADEQPGEDEISDPDEDSLAGQMSAMRGGKVKKALVEENESDDDSSTDDEDSGDSSSSSDSD